MHDDDATAPDAEQVFEMDPERTLVMLARSLVNGQLSLAEMRRQTRELVDRVPDPEQARQLTANLVELEEQWRRDTLPSMVASFRLALEVLDTFGPGHTRIDDAMDARIWNNKYFVWCTELAGRRLDE